MSKSAALITGSLLLIMVCVIVILLSKSPTLVAVSYFVIPVIIMVQSFLILFMKDDSKPANPEDWYEH
jgi:uncharacterized membrane protein YkvI